MMTRTITRRRMALAVAGLGALLATPALAGMPKVLDRVPADASAVIVIDNLNKFDQHFNQFVGAIEMPSMVTPSQMLNQLGIGQNLNMDGSAALVVLSFDMEAEDGEFIVLAPTDDFDSLVGDFNATDDGGGISAFSVEDDTVYAKRIGSWAALSDDRETVANFSGKSGNLGAFKSNFGASGVEMAGGSDIFLSISPAALAPLVEKMQEELQNNMGAIPGANAEQMEQQMEMASKIMEGFVRDGSNAGFGIRFGAMGVVTTSSLSFKPGTEGANLFQGGGNSSKLMGKLPAGPFLLAGAFDNTAPIAMATMEWVKNSGMMEMNEAMGMGAFNMNDLYEHMTGAAFAAYPNAAGLMGGVLANAVAFTASDNPAKLKSAMQDKFSKMNMDNEDLGMSITTDYTPNETQIAGKSADAYSINISMGGMGGAAMMFNPMQMIFGSANGPSGYLVKANGGVYQSYSRSSSMLATAVEGGSSLSNDRAIAKVSENLPEGRYAEFYVGVSPILEQVVPILGMMGIPPLDLPAQMPPIGFGVASRDGGAVVGSFVPAQTIKAFVEIAETVSALKGGMPGGDDDGPAF